MQGFKSWYPSLVMIVKHISVLCQVEVPAWNFKIFVAKQLLIRRYEKVILRLFFKNVLVSINSSFWPPLNRKIQFSEKDTERSFIFFCFLPSTIIVDSYVWVSKIWVALGIWNLFYPLGKGTDFMLSKIEMSRSFSQKIRLITFERNAKSKRIYD